MKIGILGGGQLARMLVESSYKYDPEFKILAKEENSPAGKIVREVITGDWNDEKCLELFAEGCDVVTLENEFIDYKKIEYIEKLGKKVYPSSGVIRLIQDKLVQKETICALGINVADFSSAENKEDIKNFAAAHGYPVVLKSRTMGYDGKGNYLVESEADIDEAYNSLSKRGKLMCESFIRFEKEIAVQAVRNPQGEIKIYPVVETIQKNHICHLVKASGELFGSLKEKVEAISVKILERLDYVGTLGIEMFLKDNDTIIVNELAPRVHNSGHYTIEGCFTSQFENHIRAVLSLPPGNTDMVIKSAVMINILGERDGKAEIKGLSGLLKHDNVYLHLYGKEETRKERKMGHITVLGEDLYDAVRTAEQCREAVDI
jgi:5-(carboxyamino)imidazole ribonucleotide synthase